MSEVSTNRAERESTLLKLPVFGLLIYWFLDALVAPVTIYDSHVYNMARLLIIQKGGLFGNHVWNFFPQICYPWAFDAVHLPFLWLGAGFDLPSFACMLGLLIVIHRLVAARYGEWVAWCCNLALLALPTLVYQASSTKNDLVVVFCVGVWFYALSLWQERGARVYLFWMALALAFAAGVEAQWSADRGGLDALQLVANAQPAAAPISRICRCFGGVLPVFRQCRDLPEQLLVV